jgi:hypothetical protein
MSDPEILDPEGPTTAGVPTTSLVERLVTEVQKALPGRTVRVDVEDRPPRAPHFRLEAVGEGGAIGVSSGPFFTVTVSFRSARFGFSLATGPEAVIADIAARVKSIADEDIVIFEEPSSPPLLRTVVLAVADGRIDAVIDSGLAPGTVDGARLSSFQGAWSRAPTKLEMKRIDQLTGGVVAKLKRKVLAKIVSKTAGSLQSAVEQAAAAIEPPGAQSAVVKSTNDGAGVGRKPDDGSRKLKGG